MRGGGGGGGRGGGGGTLGIFRILSKLRASLIAGIQTQGSRTGRGGGGRHLYVNSGGILNALKGETPCS